MPFPWERSGHRNCFPVTGRFVICKSKGIHVVINNFNANFWETVVIKVNVIL